MWPASKCIVFSLQSDIFHEVQDEFCAGPKEGDLSMRGNWRVAYRRKGESEESGELGEGC